MDEELQKARERVEKEFTAVKESLGDLYVAMEAMRAAGPDDPLQDLLGAVEDAAKKARTGGVLGSGAKSHTKALKDYQELLEADAAGT
jgi:hypothetical protein